ncbi:MAG: cryptochrome/photolyase family protein [Lentisphaeraceae bacterium]|nr:cryptochrome/photolyase family protein [Lentisphaeraceae bacterium]
MKCLRLILGDQLHESISSLSDVDSSNDLIVMMEIKTETGYADHHKKKLIFILSAMRHFGVKLSEKFKVKYFKFGDEDNRQSFVENMRFILDDGNFDKLVVTEPGEYRLLKIFEDEFSKFDVEVEIREDDRFLTTKSEFRKFALNQKDLKMENFYRMTRKKTGYLMDEAGKPVGGKWNYDHENRSAYKFEDPIQPRLRFEADSITQDVMRLVECEFDQSIGDSKDFNEPVTTEQAIEVYEYFLENILQLFGKYQDAMIDEEPLMFHSRISHLINVGILPVKYVCDKVVKKVGSVPLSSIEGFLRQTIGWREYIRGVYWLWMPDYKESNFFSHYRKLPKFYWDAKTDMNCVRSVVQDTIKNAYSHHIQRLMITGNLALLMEVNPKEVHDWYLGVYDDAYEWVELPNTFGMALYADGGAMSTKPYVSSGNYINKMSNFCKSCSYSVKLKTGESACPFNYLYWYFLDKNKEKLSSNRRLFMPYRNLAKKTDKDLQEIHKSSERFLKRHF